ncbi:hypothetical protein [Rhizobium leguminosarum]|uniref:hypothetical protein n=1 Tax=Rhizobium leguminosarum TaxID=384 RepID=UPI0014418231|nr:hypothetical protein [Rhizobium leguminosarum]
MLLRLVVSETASQELHDHPAGEKEIRRFSINLLDGLEIDFDTHEYCVNCGD